MPTIEEMLEAADKCEFCNHPKAWHVTSDPDGHGCRVYEVKDDVKYYCGCDRTFRSIDA